MSDPVKAGPDGIGCGDLWITGEALTRLASRRYPGPATRVIPVPVLMHTVTDWHTEWRTEHLTRSGFSLLPITLPAPEWASPHLVWKWQPVDSDPNTNRKDEAMARVTGSRITRLRAHWSPKIDAGDVKCRRCHETIRPGQVWDLGHEHDLALGGNPRGVMLPEHAKRADCSERGNRSAGATLGNQLRHRPRRRLSEWLR